MTESFWIAVGTASWLGVLTSISPCPLATNIAAITYIGNRVQGPVKSLLSGLAYTLGRTLTYVALAALIVASVWSIPDLAFFLQKDINKVLGPLLIVVGLFLIEVIRFNLPVFGLSDKRQRRIERLGVAGAGLLGLVFALSFCPVTAALFFGSLVPLAVEQESPVLIPTLFGLGTALPVVVFAALIAAGSRLVGQLFNRLTQIEKYARRVTGVIFILVGIYYTLIYIFGIQLI